MDDTIKEKLDEALKDFASSYDEEKETNPWIKRMQTLPAYTLDVKRDGSDEYYRALTEAILAITKGDHGYIDYKDYKLYYSDTPSIKSISLKDGHKEYSYEIAFNCDALSFFCFEEYHSEDERMAYLDPENDLFEKTLALLDRQLEELDKGTWIKKKKKLDIYDFKDYSPENRRFKQTEWDSRVEEAENTLAFLMEEAHKRSKGHDFTEGDFEIISEVIRRMVFFADYGKRNSLVDLQGYIWFKWKPAAKRDQYIWRCMDEFGQGDLPDRLLDNCTIYYFLEDPQGWEAMAYLLPIVALAEMNEDYEPDDVKNEMLRVFDLIPENGYKERIEKLIEYDRKDI